RALQAPYRPVFITGYGERLTHKSLPAMPDLLESPLRHASNQAFAMAGTKRDDIDLACFYDCFSITVLLSLEQAGFCQPGSGSKFMEEHDLRWNGDFPVNSHGGMLGFGQALYSGGLSHVIEIVRQIQNRAGPRQIANCNQAYCNGNGGIMSEQVALILEGA